MARRKLSDRQKRRINKRHQHTRTQADSSVKASTDGQPETINTETTSSSSELMSGTVITNYGRQALVEDDASKNRALCHLRANLGTVVTGDMVVWCASEHDDDELGVVSSIYPRKSLLQRPDSYGKLKPVAANVSQMLITIAVKPEPHFHLIDRYLVAAEQHQLNPVILLNKSDLINDSHTLLIEKLKFIYNETLGYTLLILNSHSDADQVLKNYLIDHTSIFVGQSGVGKSSLVKRLLPEHDIKIGALSGAEIKGKHTTTHSCLYDFPWGGRCVDSPGIREFGMWHLNKEEVLDGFKELRDHGQHCRFRDCSHQHEPGCAILLALEQKKILKERYESYLRIVNHLDDITIKQSL